MGVEVLSKADQKGQIVTVTTSISSSASVSAAVDLGSYRLVGIVMPAGWDAAALTFQASVDGSAFVDVYGSDGTELSWTVAASRFVRSNPVDFWALRYLKLRSGTSGTPVNQTATRNFTIVAVPHS